MNDDELTMTLLRKIDALENRVEYLESVEKYVFTLVQAQRFWSGTLTVADDDAETITPDSTIGIILINGRNTAYDEVNALITYRALDTTYCRIIAQSDSAVEVTTGALTGLDGSDGVVTVSPHTDGLIYVENRFGASITIAYTLLG